MNAQDVQIARAAVAEVRSKMDPESLARVLPVKITAKSCPDAEDIKRGCFPGQKAAYYGIPCELGIQGALEIPSAEAATGEIFLFLDNLVPVTPERLFVAVLHEYMHALGHDEETIQAMGLWLDGGPPCTPF